MSVQQVDNPFGIEFLTEVPPEPVLRERDDDRWEAVKTILRTAPGEWAVVKKYPSKGGASQKMSNINSDKFKTLPAKQWEARVRTFKGEDRSELCLAYKGEDGTVKPRDTDATKDEHKDEPKGELAKPAANPAKK